MFGKPSQNNPGGRGPAGHPSNNGQSGTTRPPVADEAQIQGGGLAQIIVTAQTPLTYYLFLNDQFVSQMDIESLNVAIEAPSDTEAGSGVIRATLARYVDAITGGKTVQRTELFPCTLEIVAQKRRLSVICQDPNTFDGLFLTVGLQPDGNSRDLNGVQSLTVLLTEGLFDAKIVWNDGLTESVFPQS